MKNIVHNINPLNSRSEKFQHWSKIIAVTFSAQAVIQILGLITGVLIVRLLPTKEYAFYTIANTMLGTMTVLADGGISSGVMAFGGKVWKDRAKLGAVLATGLKLRKRFGLVSLLISLPVLAYLLLKHDAGILTTLLIILAIIPSFFAALSDSLLEVPLKLHQSINMLQKNQTMAGVGRFAMMTSTLLIAPWTFIAVLGNGIPRLWANIRLRKISARYADTNQAADPVTEKEILGVVRRALPGAIYYCVSGQITIWLISIFGNTESIAHIGALSRLSAVVTIFSTLCNALIVPRFARLEDDRKMLLKRFLQTEILLLAISVFLVGAVMLYPTQILFILGSEYTELTSEVVLITISSCLAMILGVTYALLIARGWIINPAINIPINLLFQLLFVVLVDMSTTANVIYFTIADYVVSYLIFILFFIYQLRRHQPKLT
jgi:O-antigen/teichoic acid export membrane protein